MKRLIIMLPLFITWCNEQPESINKKYSSDLYSWYVLMNCMPNWANSIADRDKNYVRKSGEWLREDIYWRVFGMDNCIKITQQ